MCHTFLSQFTRRRKGESSIKIRRKLKKIFKELAFRCGGIYLDRDQFLRLTELPGLLGEQVFNSLDEDEDNKLDVKEFVLGISIIYQGRLEAVTDFLFKIFNFSRNGQINRADVKCIYEYLPNHCQKCGKDFKPEWEISSKIEELFENDKYLFYEPFHERLIEDADFGEHVLQNILSFMPEIFNAIFIPKFSEKALMEGTLKFKNRVYYAILANKAINYSICKGGNIKGMILVSDMFVEEKENCEFSIKNNKFTYDFTASSAEEQEKWLQKLKVVSKFRNISIDYSISKRVIGKGAYGKVKLAKKLGENLPEELVAIKIISKEPLDPRSETRLRREISILKICKHENIVQLKDIYETSKKLYIITEYIQGGSLFSWLKTRGFKVSEEITKVLIFQIANAVSYLHSYGICHRDIKLENILLETSNGLKPKLIDFGLSCILGPGQYSQEAVGTLKYASPELISRIPYRETPDIWGIGVIMYILLTGKIPFYGENDQEIANRILKKKIDIENERWNGISQDAKEIVVKLLTRKASDRMKLQDLLIHNWFKDLNSIDITKHLN
ncbi:hypothetical protein SteCoe_23631 [Stentor coeruleus]|uniref:Uncharacterized protein n=1 Tax=Stentor coeruleus TaxID=5963 RepID=A0A1R2BJH5_9CILI|nr:hypothetical protein SteCoe_23631 [Stentor coeruleus]